MAEFKLSSNMFLRARSSPKVRRSERISLAFDTSILANTDNGNNDADRQKTPKPTKISAKSHHDESLHALLFESSPKEHSEKTTRGFEEGTDWSAKFGPGKKIEFCYAYGNANPGNREAWQHYVRCNELYCQKYSSQIQIYKDLEGVLMTKRAFDKNQADICDIEESEIEDDQSDSVAEHVLEPSADSKRFETMSNEDKYNSLKVLIMIEETTDENGQGSVLLKDIVDGAKDTFAEEKLILMLLYLEYRRYILMNVARDTVAMIDTVSSVESEFAKFKPKSKGKTVKSRPIKRKAASITRKAKRNKKTKKMSTKALAECALRKQKSRQRCLAMKYSVRAYVLYKTNITDELNRIIRFVKRNRAQYSASIEAVREQEIDNSGQRLTNAMALAEEIIEDFRIDTSDSEDDSDV